MRGANADALIARLNPIITGWAAYYRIGVSKRAYGTLDAHLWRLAWKWAKFSHPNKPRRWIITRHFGMFNPARQDKWVFGSRDTGFYLRKFAWTKIVRHRMVAGRASPDDPALTGYWQQRRRRDRLPVDPATWHLLPPARPVPALPGTAAARRLPAPEPGGMAAVAYRHAQGDPQARDRQRDGPRHPGRTSRIPPHTRTLPPPDRQRHQPGASARFASLRACLSRAARKRARPVLRGPRRGNAPGLPDERWFAELTNRKLRRSAHRSVTELETDIRKWINEWNKAPKPFVWTKSADEILETLAAYCQRIIDSGHYEGIGPMRARTLAASNSSSRIRTRAAAW